MNPSSVAKIFSVLCIVNWLLPATYSVEIYVSNEKTTDANTNCGSNKDDPCSSINAAIQHAEDYYRVIIKDTGVPYEGCPFFVDKPLAFAGSNGKPIIDCEDKEKAFVFNLNPDAPEIKDQSVIKLDVSNLKIQNSKIGFSFLKKTKNVNLRLDNIDFVDNNVDVSWGGGSHLCYLVMTNVNAVGRSGYGIEIEGCNKTTLEMSQTKFRGKYLKVVSTKKSSFLVIKMNEVTFDMSNRAKEIESNTQSPFYAVTALEQSTITIESSNFSNHLGDRHSMFNITAFTGKLKKVSVQYTSGVNLNFNNTKFINNTVRNGVGAAVSFNLTNSLTGKIRHRILFNMSTFVGNTALKGGAVWFSGWKKKAVSFNRTTFVDNKAIDPEEGSGGALFGMGGKVQITFSKFEGNTATKFGGTLYLSTESSTTLKVSDSVFQNQHSWSSIEGDVMHLKTVQTFFTGNVVFNLSSSNSREAILSYDGSPSVLYMTNATTFICPRGYNYEEAKYTKKLGPVKDYKYQRYHIFAFTCKPCQDLFYTTARGSWKVGGTQTRGKCHKCPFGASCNGTIRARANFWGRVEDDQVEMIPCPKGYCCDEEPCGSYDSCRSHRTGTLCGHCSDGYTEGMSSTQCFPNENCNEAWWAWPVFNVVLIFVFLSFHQEFIKRLVKWSLWTDDNNDTDGSIEYRGNERNHNTNNPGPLESNSLLPDSHDELIDPVDDPLPLTHDRPDYTAIEESPEYNSSDGYIKVFYYFYQAVLLIRLSSYVSNTSFPNWIIDLLTPLLNFQFTNIWTCAGEHWRPVTKVFVKNTVAYWVLGCSFIVYVLYRLLKKYKRMYIDDEPGFKPRSVPVRLIGTVIHVILLSYVAQTQFTVQLLNCVEVGDQNVLFIDGSVTCDRPYQVAVWIYFVFAILAFPFTLFVGQTLLFSGRISCKQFLLACFLPLFYLCYWGYRHFKHQKGEKSWPKPQCDAIDPLKEKIKYILRHSYKSTQSNNPTKVELFRENWEFVLLLRRLILVVVFIFVKSFVLRAYLFFILSVLFLLGHVFVQPFENDNVNKLDNVALAVVVLISGLSISEATYNNTGQLIPYDVEMLQMLQDWFLALLPIVMLCVFLGPRAKYHFLQWRHRRRGNLPVPTEDETVVFNRGVAGETQLDEAPRWCPA